MAFRVLVIERQAIINWSKLLGDIVLENGYKVCVEQGDWVDIHHVVMDKSGVFVTMNKSKSHKKQGNQSVPVKVDFVLLRSPIESKDSENKFQSLLCTNIPSLNSLQSTYLFLDKSIVNGTLKGIAARVGYDNIPLNTVEIQKIGDYSRTFGSVGTESITDTPIEYREMIEECAKIFGGLEILSLRLVHSRKDNKEFILELNNYFDIQPVHEQQDTEHIVTTTVASINSYVALQTKETNNTHPPKPKSENEDIFQHPFVWLQSLLVIILLALLYASHQVSLLPRDYQDNIVPPFSQNEL